MSAAARPLGRSGLSTPPLVLGGNVFGWTADRAASLRVLDAFVDGGGTMIDTANGYSSWVPGHDGGESERMIGDWLRASGKRDRVIVATKVGMSGDPATGNLAADHIVAKVDESLARLGIERIDLLFAHRDDVTRPVDDPLETFAGLVRAGKVRAIAASNFEPDRLAAALDASEAHGWPRYEVLQPLYNLLERGFEGALGALARTREIGVTPFYGLAAGYLTGKYREAADVHGARAGSVRGYVEGRGPAMLAAMDAVAAETGASLAQIALAWLAAKPGITASIASATSAEQVEELLGAMRLTLAPEHIERLDAAA